MEQIIIGGVDASGVIEPGQGRYALIKSIEIDFPLDEVGTTDPTVTLSGSYTGAKTFHSDTTLDWPFRSNEDVYITTSNFTAEYQAIIRYLYGGHEMQCAMVTRDQYQKRPTPWRFRD